MTFQDFVDYGIERHSIAPAIREAQALGLLEVTEKGRAGNAEWRKPNLFRLTYRPAKGLPGFGTNEWRRFETLEEARAVAQRARAQRAEKANDRWGNLPTFGGETPIENVNATAAKPALHDKVVKPTLLSISRGGSAEEPDREARPSGSAVASDPARMEGIEVVQNRIAQRIGRDGWNILGDLPIADLDRITLLECEGELTDGALADVLRARAAK